MAKIGTAHIEIKPVLNEEALDAICRRIEDAVAAGVKRGLERPPIVVTAPGKPGWLPCDFRVTCDTANTI